MTPDGWLRIRNDRHGTPPLRTACRILAAYTMPLPPPPTLFSGHKGAVYAVSGGTAPERIFSGAGDGYVVEWDLDHPDDGVVLIRVGQAVFSLCHVAEGAWLLVGTEGGALHVVNMTIQRETQLLDAHRQGIFRILPIPGGRVACAAGDGILSVWDTTGDRLTLVRRIPLAEDKLRDLALSPDGEELAVACGDGTIRILDTRLFNEPYTLHPPGTPSRDTALTGIGAVAYHPHKPVLVSGGKDGHLRAWRRDEDYRHLLAFPAHASAVYGIRFNDPGELCATVGRDKSTKVWDAGTFAPLLRLDKAAGGHDRSVNTLHWQGQHLVTAGDDRMVRAWRVFSTDLR